MNNKANLNNDYEPTLFIPPELDAVLNSIPKYVLLVDESHHILYANSSLLATFNMEIGQILGGYCPLIIHGKNEPIPECPLDDCLLDNKYIEREVYDVKNNAWISSAIYPTSLISLQRNAVPFAETK